MAEAEQPERLRGDRQVTVDDVRQLVASATPHFAYQIRNRIQKLVAALPADGVGQQLLGSQPQPLVGVTRQGLPQGR